jgi:hypothetical protein
VVAALGLSDDGSAVVVTSDAPDITADDSNGFQDVFLRRPLR